MTGVFYLPLRYIGVEQTPNKREENYPAALARIELATVRRPPDYRKETQTAVAWSCLPFIRSGKSHLTRHSERGKKTRQAEEEVGRQQQGMDRPGVRQVPEGSGEQRKMEETG